MSSASPQLDELESAAPGHRAGLPSCEYVFAPTSIEEAQRVMVAASHLRRPVKYWGGGTHQTIGHASTADVLMSSAAMAGVIAWEPDDLTVVVEAGASVAELEATLAERGQTAGLPEVPGPATVGGVVATGTSGFRRARYGPTRDRMLEVTLVTGDGRAVRGGGRVVKNVTGYDLPRLATGSLGALGFVASVCLKLWPLPEASATVMVADPVRAARLTYRPLAVLETETGASVYLQGPARDVASEADRLQGDPQPGLVWPSMASCAHLFSLRVPPAATAEAIRALPPGRFVAQHLVGEVAFCPTEIDLDLLGRLRVWAESVGGRLVTMSTSIPIAFDPWGAPPDGLALQRRLIAAFDPFRVSNPGRLPGMA